MFLFALLAQANTIYSIYNYTVVSSQLLYEKKNWVSAGLFVQVVSVKTGVGGCKVSRGLPVEY